MTNVVVAADKLLVAQQQQISVVRASTNTNTILERPQIALVLAAQPMARAVIQRAASPLVVVAAGMQGPPGPAGAAGSGGEEAMPYATRTDFVGDDVIYKGRAVPGSLDSAPVWQIWRVTIGIDGDVSEQWAAGTAAFDKVWADRAALGYA